VRTILMSLAAIGTTGLGAADLMGQIAGVALEPHAMHLNVRLLPPGTNADGAEALAIVDGTSNTMMVGGAVRAANTWRPVYWEVTPTSASLPHELPNESGGRVNAVSISGSPEYFCTFVGTTFDDQAREHPALWLLGTDRSGVAERTDLPTPGNRGGDSVHVAMGDVNGDGVAEIIACGWSFGVTQTALATVWVGTPESGFARRVLPSLVPDGYAEATASSITLNDWVVFGTAVDGNGTPHAVMWTMDSQVATIETICNLPAGFGSAVQDIAVENDETHWIGHDIISPAGVARPALSHETVNGTWEMQTLPLIGGMNAGHANSIIAILIGLLVGGEAHGPNGQSAMIWINQDKIPPSAIDLNRVASNRPAGVRLESVNMILPYIEQGNVYKLVGDARNAAGAPLAFVAGLYRD
jgi:hypothetical protein